MDNIVTLKIRKDVLDKLNPLLSDLLSDKTKNAQRWRESAAEIENGEKTSGISAEIYRQWAEDDGKAAETLLAAMYAMYGQAE